MKSFYQLIFILTISLLVGSMARAQGLSLEIKGKNAAQDSIIRSYYTTKKVKDFTGIDREIAQLRDTLNKSGYIDFQVSLLDKENDTLYIGMISLGERTTQLSVCFRESYIKDYLRQLKIPFSEDRFTIDPAQTETTLNQLVKLEAQAGFPLSLIRLVDLKFGDNLLSATLQVSRESMRKLDAVSIKGYAKFPEAYIKRYARLKPNTPFNQTTISSKAELIDQLPFVTSTKEPEVLFTKDSTEVFLYLEKNNANRFDGFLGFGSDADSGKLRLDGYLNLYLLNNLNYGELLELNYKSDGNGQQNLRVAVEAPYLFSSPLGVQAELYLFRRDSTFSTTRQRLDLLYQLSGNSRFRAGVTLENSTDLENEATTLLGTTDYKKTLFGLGYAKLPYSKDKLLGPKYHMDLYGAIGNREAAGIKESQFAIELSGSYTFRLTPKNTIYISNTTKSIFSDNYLPNELYRFGGINSIRGFQENGINANLYSVFRTEYRFIPASNLYVHSIIDAAYFENQNISQDGLLYGLGFGAGILTKSGLLNINLANGLQEGQNFKFANSILHLRFTAFF